MGSYGWFVLRFDDVGFFYEELRKGKALLLSYLRRHLRENSSSEEGRMGI